MQICGAGGEIAVPMPDFPDPSTARADDPSRTRTWSCVLIVDVTGGADFPTISGVSWAEGEVTPNLMKPDGSAPSSHEGRYFFTLMHDPVAGDVLSFGAGARF